ncbi:uncharacterized protein LOC118193841 [Stegodyphus dumicola]|uniref:uncharacterized protein LOC118193841 n=1 Tax=Stegodyphus dumicola TaxID=202533 RepID=UPI0015B0EBE6|nr:uncharacterized protein LOC118193841 [Stegodyphus dumicola]
MPLEILDVKLGDMGPLPISTLHQSSFYPNRNAGEVISGKTFHPVYEEVCQAPSGDKSITGKSYESDFEESGKLGGHSVTSEDDFAEDEFSVAEYPSREGSGQCSATSSVRGSTGGDLCKDTVSSDEGVREDDMISDSPEMSLGDNSFNYPRHLCIPRDISSEKRRGNPMQTPHSHQQNAPTYPLPERTANILAPIQRITGLMLGNQSHSKPLTDSKKRMSPSRIPSSSFAPPVPTTNAKTHLNTTSVPVNAPWMMKHGHDDRVTFPASSSQENIYSTIDEDELADYSIHPTLTSLVCPQHASPPGKHSSAVPKSVPVRGERPIQSPNHRNAEDSNSSYGDIMPAFNSASFT